MLERLSFGWPWNTWVFFPSISHKVEEVDGERERCELLCLSCCLHNLLLKKWQINVNFDIYILILSKRMYEIKFYSQKKRAVLFPKPLLKSTIRPSKSLDLIWIWFFSQKKKKSTEAKLSKSRTQDSNQQTSSAKETKGLRGWILVSKPHPTRAKKAKWLAWPQTFRTHCSTWNTS